MQDAFRRGVAAFHRGEIGLARRLLRAAIRTGGATSPWACQQLVQTYLQRGESSRAGPALAALPVATEALRQFGLGYLFARTGRPLEATRLLERAAGSAATAGAAGIGLAAIRTAGGRIEDALRLAHSSEATSRRHGDAWGLGAALGQRAAIALRQGGNREAIRLAGRAAALRRRTGDRLGLGLALQTTAQALYRLARYGEAVGVLDQALALHVRSGHHLDAAVVHNNVGLWHLDLANPALAARSFAAARKLLGRQRDPGRAGAIAANLGNAFRQLGDLSRAVRAYDRALALLPRASVEARGIALAELADVHCRRGRPERALALLTRERPGIAQASAATLGLGDVELARARFQLGDRAGALAAARRALRRVSRSDPASLGRATCEIRGRCLRARVLLASGRRAAATVEIARTERLLQALLGRQESAHVRMGLVESYREAHDALVAADLASGRGGAARAWRTAARFKARELTASRRAVGGETGRLASPGRQALPPALLEYHVGADTTHVFVVEQGRVGVVDLGLGERKLQAAIARLLRPLAAAARSGNARLDLLDFDPGAAARLYRVLLAPALARFTRPAAELVIVPDGPLHLLPFELLVSAIDAGTAPFSGVRFAVESLALSYARSSRLRRPAATAAPRSVLGLAYSPLPRARLRTADGPIRLAPLGGARDEVEAVGQSFARASLHHGAAASVERYRRLAPGHDVIHIAAHAFGDAPAPGAAGIVLAGATAGAGPGFLAAEAVRAIPLRARLVTLSACDSGLGLLRAREGTLGLARAFHEAGAEAVVATLWPVDDRAAVDLMRSFYRRLGEGQAPALALAAAKREMRQACGRHLFPPRAHPYYWAPFVLLDGGRS